MLDGVQMSTNTRINGDRQVKVDESLITKDEEQKGYMYAFLSTDELSASIWSNTENSLAKIDSRFLCCKDRCSKNYGNCYD